MKLETIKNFFKTRAAKSIVVASCALLIGLAVYLNYEWQNIVWGPNPIRYSFSCYIMFIAFLAQK